ncbi:hypothetical protein MFU01_33740 [Myxococcus fulvus]|uniref:Uncharacterized protein n=1 Tax=Myxococcus fulvus TaxID=33 RepID=A0A511T364_MYXFU|nr:hypothetical protein MFU01_33740 [Myxococcus fulvus]
MPTSFSAASDAGAWTGGFGGAAGSAARAVGDRDKSASNAPKERGDEEFIKAPGWTSEGARPVGPYGGRLRLIATDLQERPRPPRAPGPGYPFAP